jgi:hypothetical protein
VKCPSRTAAVCAKSGFLRRKPATEREGLKRARGTGFFVRASDARAGRPARDWRGRLFRTRSGAYPIKITEIPAATIPIIWIVAVFLFYLYARSERKKAMSKTPCRIRSGTHFGRAGE